MPGASPSASGNPRFWSRRRWQSNTTSDTPIDHRSATSRAEYLERGSSSPSLQDSGDYFQSAAYAPSAREQRHRVLRRVSSAISPASPSFATLSSVGTERYGMDAAHSPISPLTPEALKRRATRLGSLIGKGRREDVMGTRDGERLQGPRDQVLRPSVSQTFSSSEEQRRSAPSGVPVFPQQQRLSGNFSSEQRLSATSTQSYQTRSDHDQGSPGYQRSSYTSRPISDDLNTLNHGISNTSTSSTAYTNTQPYEYPEAPPQHIVSVRTYPPPSMSRRPSTPPRSHPRRPSEQSDGFQDASELAAFAEATSALSFFPDSGSRRSSRGSIATGPRSSARGPSPNSSHRPSSSRSAASPARMAAPLPAIPGSTPSRSRSSNPRTLPRHLPRNSLGPPPTGPLPLPPTGALAVPSTNPSSPPSMQRSTSYASTFSPTSSSSMIPPPSATPTTPEGVQHSGSTTSNLTTARSRSPLLFNLPSRTLTDIAPPPTRRRPTAQTNTHPSSTTNANTNNNNPNNNIITRSQALAEALQGMDADDGELATGHGSGNLHEHDGSGGGGDDELPDYATSQMEYAAKQRWEAALRARELDEAWRRGRGRGLR